MKLSNEIFKQCSIRLGKFGYNLEFENIKPIHEADEYSLVWFDPQNKKLELIEQTKAKIIITSYDIYEKVKNIINKTFIITDYPRDLVVQIINDYFSGKANLQINPLFSNKTVYTNVQIGNGVKIGEYAVIGRNGFFIHRDKKGRLWPFPNMGGVIIGDNVVIGAYSSIDRGIFNNTIIGSHCQIDSLVHVGHNTIIGKNCILCAGITIGGNTIIGDNCWIGMEACIRDGIEIGNNAIIGMGAVVCKNVSKYTTVAGNPAKNLSIKYRPMPGHK